MRLVIRGAVYFADGEILIPHYTGEYNAVDCTRYLTKADILSNYSKSYFKDNKSNFIEYEGVKYYYAEYSLYHISEDWELLSDLSEIFHEEDNNSF